MKKALFLLLTAALTAPLRAADKTGSCEVRVSGSESVTFKGLPDRSSAMVDYWTSMADMMAHGKTPDEKTPFMQYIINCVGEKGQISLVNVGDATRKDLPYKPATYPLVNSSAPDKKAGQMGVVILLSQSNEAWEVKGVVPGGLQVTRLDASGMAGKFSFTAKSFNNPKKSIQVQGTFDFPCAGDKCK